MSSMPPPPPAPPPPPPMAPMPGGQQFEHAGIRAGFGARLAGYLLDGLLYGLLLAVFVGAGVGIIVASIKDCLDKYDLSQDNDIQCASNEVNGPLLFLGVVIIALGLLFVIFLYVRALGRTGQTWGRKIIGVKVVDMYTEQPLGFGRALGRSLFAHFISSLFCDLGYLWMLWDPEKQCWHDKVVGSVVVRV